MTDPSDPAAPTVGLVLGGGGIAGYAFHCAVLTALTAETGFDARMAEIIVGTSAGAIAGAFLRGGVPAAELRSRLVESTDDPEDFAVLRRMAGRTPQAIPRFWAGPGSPAMLARELRRGRRLNPPRLVAALIPRGRLPLEPIAEPLHTLHPDRWPEPTLWIPATDLELGHRHVFGRDECPPMATAVQASSALPGLFAPIEIGGRTYIDGGVASPFNADLLVEAVTGGITRPDLVIVLAPLSIDGIDLATPFSTVARSIPRRVLGRELRALEQAGMTTLVLQPDRPMVRAMGLNPMAPGRVGPIVAEADRLIDQQLRAAPRWVRGLLVRAGELLPAPTDSPLPTSEPSR